MEKRPKRLTHDDCVVFTRLELFQCLEPVLCRVVGEAAGFDAHFNDLFALEVARIAG